MSLKIVENPTLAPNIQIPSQPSEITPLKIEIEQEDKSAVDIEKSLKELYGENAIKDLTQKMGLENESLLNKIKSLFQSVHKNEIATNKGFGRVSELQPLFQPYLEAEGLFAIGNALLATPLKAKFLSIIFDKDPLIKAKQIRQFLEDNLSELKSIRALTLRNYQMKVLPLEIKYFSGLQTLDLSHNKLEILPSELFSLKYLKNLYVSCNRLTEFPKELADLSHLSNLQFDRNQLKTVPEEIGKLEKLQVLNLSGNFLVKIPDSIGKLQSLLYLYLDNNQIEQLPTSIGQLQRLGFLYLYNNRLVDVPSSIGKLKNLQILSIPNNGLKELPFEIGQISTLRSLLLDNNNLKELPESLNQLQSLTHLTLCGNPLTSFPKEMGNLKKLLHFSFDERSVDFFPKSILELPFWSKNPTLYPRAEMKGANRVLNLRLANFDDVYLRLGSKKWMECIDGCYHHFGKDVFDKGLHGNTPEAGFLQSMENLFVFLSQQQNRVIDPDFYLELLRISCSHFDGDANGTLMGKDKVGVFRNMKDTISADFQAPHYEIDQKGLTEFSDLSGKLSLMFGACFRLGDMYVVAENPKKVRIVYQPLKEDQVRTIFNFLLTEFFYDIGHAANEEEMLEAIAKFNQHVEWLHPPRDGCGRTDTALLNALLSTYGFHPVILDYPYVSSCKGLKTWVAALKQGMKAWELLN